MSKKNIDFFCITKKVGNILTIYTLTFIILFFSITKINSYDYDIDKIKNAVEIGIDNYRMYHPRYLEIEECITEH